jgi:hypothetical protein
VGRFAEHPGERPVTASTTVPDQALRQVDLYIDGASGVGRESGIGAIADYQETRAVWVELTGATRDPFTLG